MVAVPPTTSQSCFSPRRRPPHYKVAFWSSGIDRRLEVDLCTTAISREPQQRSSILPVVALVAAESRIFVNLSGGRFRDDAEHS
jgi:hypothetical protein